MLVAVVNSVQLTPRCWWGEMAGMNERAVSHLDTFSRVLLFVKYDFRVYIFFFQPSLLTTNLGPMSKYIMLCVIKLPP